MPRQISSRTAKISRAIPNQASLIKIPCLIIFLLWTSTAVAQRVIVISDLNGQYGSTQFNKRVSTAVEAIKELKPDLVISAGDMIAGQKRSLGREQIDRMWKAFHDVVSDPLAEAGIDFAVAVGNHDGSAFPGFELERERFRENWSRRQLGFTLLAGSDWPRRYSFYLDDLLFIVIDGTRPGRLQEADRKLLTSVLEKEGESAASIIVVSHLPIWSFAQGRESEIIRDPGFDDLLKRYSVDLLITGHHHVYYPGIDENGLVNLAAGPLGGNSRTRVGDRQQSAFSFTIVDFCDSGFRVSARKAPEYTEEDNLASLPQSIPGKEGHLIRMDLASGFNPDRCRD